MLDFLKNVQVTAPEKTPTSKGGGGVRKERNPLTADLRLFADGSIYPSEELAIRFNLEYGNKPAEDMDPIGNGFDVINSEEFKQYIPVGRRCIWISPVPRAEPKLDIFGTTTYNEDGTPKSSVMDQGSVTYGKATLWPLIKEAYGIELTENEKFIDLNFYGGSQDEAGNQFPFVLPPGKTLAFVPKAIERGEKKGTATVQRRENPEFWCLYPNPEWMTVHEATVLTAAENGVGKLTGAMVEETA
jgi:hypothetical protein